jgi:hypothetical protein
MFRQPQMKKKWGLAKKTIDNDSGICYFEKVRI